MVYAAVSDMQNRYPARDLIAVSDPTNTAIQDGPINQALSDASVEIDSYLEARFKLPLADPPAVLNLHCCTIAMYRLQSLRPLHDLEDARKRYDDVIKFLTAVSKGTLTLGLASDSAEPPQAPDSVRTASDDPAGGRARRIFDRHKLRTL